mgnify:CR=1
VWRLVPSGSEVKRHGLASEPPRLRPEPLQVGRSQVAFSAQRLPPCRVPGWRLKDSGRVPVLHVPSTRLLQTLAGGSEPVG